jgi:hypothetical protein
MRLSVFFPYSRSQRPEFAHLLIAAAPWLLITLAALYALRA